MTTGEWRYLHSQMKVPLNQLLIILGPVADGIVHFENTGVSRQ